MSEPTLLPVTPGSLSQKDMDVLFSVGVIVIEHARPKELRLLRPTYDIDSSEMLACALKALCDPNASSTAVQAAFTRAVGAVIASKRKTP